MIQINFNLPV